MGDIAKLEQKVRELYEQKDPNRAEWSDWLYENHVVVVADNASIIAKRVSADENLSRAAALLHDIADARMKRDNPDHELESLRIARDLLRESGYPKEDVHLVVDDAIRFHSCHNGEHPKTTEGKVLATADSVAHLTTDFYLFATWSLGKKMTLEQIKDWALKKLDRDLNDKVFFEEVREELRPDYERLKALFSR